MRCERRCALVSKLEKAFLCGPRSGLKAIGAPFVEVIRHLQVLPWRTKEFDVPSGDGGNGVQLRVCMIACGFPYENGFFTRNSRGSSETPNPYARVIGERDAIRFPLSRAVPAALSEATALNGLWASGSYEK